MAKIYLVGHQKPVHVPKHIAKKVAEFKANPEIMPGEILSLPEFTAEKREIKTVIVEDHDDNAGEVSDDRKKENDLYYARENEAYELGIKRKCFMFPEEKSQDVIEEGLIYQAFSDGAQPPLEFYEEIRRRKLEYYKKYPKHPVAPIVFKDLLPEPPRGDEMHLRTFFPAYMLQRKMKNDSEALATAKKLYLI